MLGREVKILISEYKLAGEHSVIWNATNKIGTRMSAGIYLYSITAGSAHKTQKMVLLK
jgi:flagellar hook assembly protein FlgD